MSSQLIIDNWLLQDIGSCLSDGLSHDYDDQIVIDKQSDSHTITQIPESCIQIEALFSFLIDIVFRDTLIVDSDFTETWSEHDNHFLNLVNSGLLRTIKFRDHEKKLTEPRSLIVEKLCVTSSLLELQKLNEESWEQNKKPHNEYFSAVIWGCAGMLSRSHVFEAPYSGHPLRKRVIEQSIWKSDIDDATSKVLQWIDSERMNFYEFASENYNSKQALICLPPVIIEIIEESSDVYDLIPTAFDLRDKYRQVRNWLKEVQDAIDNEDPKKILKFKKILNSVSKDINNLVNAEKFGNITIGTGGISIDLGVNLINKIRNKFGIRHQLNQHIFTSSGRNSLKKLFRMFDENNSRLAIDIENYLNLKRF